MSKLSYSYGVKKFSRRKRMENSATSSCHENCSCFISNNPSTSSRHFENTFKVIEKKHNKNNLKKASSLSSILEEPPSSLEIELEVIDRLREKLKSDESSVNSDIKNLLERTLDENSENNKKDEAIYFLSKDRSGATTLRMKFVNSLNNLSSSIKNGINGNSKVSFFSSAISILSLNFFFRTKNGFEWIKNVFYIYLYTFVHTDKSDKFSKQQSMNNETLLQHYQL